MRLVSSMKSCGGNQMAPELNFWNVTGVAINATPRESPHQYSRSIIITDKSGTFEINLHSNDAESLLTKELEA